MSDADTAPAVAATTAATSGEPQKPKRALSAYWIFSNAMREEVTKAVKDQSGDKAKLGDVAKEIASRWAAVTEAEKKVYEDKAAEDKQRHAAEFATFLAASDPAGTLRKKYEDKIPKKPLTAYFLFCLEPATREKATQALQAAGQQEPANKQLTSKLGEMWKASGAEEKAPFEERYKQEQAEFLEKQKAWQATPEFAEIEQAEKAQEEKKTAAEAEQKLQAGADEGKARGEKRGRSAPKEQASPAGKEKKAKTNSPASEAKKAVRNAGAKKGSGGPAVPDIDAEVLAEAGKLGFESSLRNLAARPEVIASGKKPRELLEALQASSGLVNPAKRALLGA